MTAATGQGLSAAVERVRLRNYRSIASCDVRLGPLTYLVGPNGAGKSNFLDALQLLSEALTTSLEQAARGRGGAFSIRRRPAPPEQPMLIAVDLRLPDATATYAVDLVLVKDGLHVEREECVVRPVGGPTPSASYAWDGEVLVSSEPDLPMPSARRLHLVTAAGLPVFRPVYDLLSRMAFYNLIPAAMRGPRPLDAGDQLASDGWNVASVLGRSSRTARGAVNDYLSAVVPAVRRVSVRSVEQQWRTLRFQQADLSSSGRNLLFDAHSTSDGTLRALGVLLAIFQDGGDDPSLVGIEEPEVAIHPAAAVLREAMAEASRSRQLVVTTQSPELLDDPSLDPETVRAVALVDGRTLITRPDQVSLSAIRDGLYTAGELLRVGQLGPEGASEQ